MNSHDETTQPYKLENFVIIRREFWEFVQDGTLSIDEFLLLSVLHIKTNPYNGICRTNYASLAEEFRGRYALNQINKMCLRLKSLHLIYFDNRRGKRGKFPIIPHRFLRAKGKITNVNQLINEKKRIEDAEGRRISTTELAELAAEPYTNNKRPWQKYD